MGKILIVRYGTNTVAQCTRTYFFQPDHFFDGDLVETSNGKEFAPPFLTSMTCLLLMFHSEGIKSLAGGGASPGSAGAGLSPPAGALIATRYLPGNSLLSR